jgi:4'-phosphopantetheinyl transferase EntD
VLRALLPPHVALAESDAPLDDGTAHAAERDAEAGMAPARRAEFRTGRALARTALTRLGRPAVGIAAGPSREPVWPDGVVGSITHCRGRYAAAVASTAEVEALGIDAEPDAPLPPEVRAVVASPTELAAVAAQGLPDRLLFCAKEAVFKAWFPRERSWLDFLDVEVSVEVDVEPGRFRVRPVAEHAAWVAGLDGRWARDGRHLAAVALRGTG